MMIGIKNAENSNVFSLNSEMISLSKYKQGKNILSKKIENIKNSEEIYTNKNRDTNESVSFLNNQHAINYVYLGSTNMPVLNNMGLTLEQDGSLLLVKGESYDLFKGLYQKHINGGFSYDVFKIISNDKNNLKFKSLYINLNGDLIGKAKDDNAIISDLEKRENETRDKQDSSFYKIKFREIKKEYELNKEEQDKVSQFIVDYESYIPDSELEKEANTIDKENSFTENIVDITTDEIENDKVLRIKRNSLEVRMKLVDHKIVIAGLPDRIASDEVDSQNPWTYHELKLPLKKDEKILGIKQVLNQIQLVVDKGKRTKIYYLNPLNIFAIKSYQYKVTRLKQEPPLSFYAKVGENNYKKYHTGQPFSTQTIGNFSSQHIPFFSSFIDNARIHIEATKQKWALKQRKAMVTNIAKIADPGFRGFFSNIKNLANKATTPSGTRIIALESSKQNIQRSCDVLAKHIVGIKNGKSHGDIVHSLVNALKENESVTVNHVNGVNAFFGMSAFSLPKNIGVNAFILANFAKTHAITLTKKDNKVEFSFLNKISTEVTGGISAGIGEYRKRWEDNRVDYGFITPITASAYLAINYEKKSNFSFSIEQSELTQFINGNTENHHVYHGENKVDSIINEHNLVDKSSLEINKDIDVALVADLRSEASFDVNVAITDSRGISIPRSAVGFSAIAKLLKLNCNINKFIDYGDINGAPSNKTVSLKLLELGLDIYRDLKFAPSTVRAEYDILWYPLATVKNFELFFKKRINAFFNIEIFNSKKISEEREFKNDITAVRGIYKRILKINKLLDSFPNERKYTGSTNYLDDIYLTISADKVLKNKLMNKYELSYRKNKIKSNIEMISENKSVQQLLLDLKERKNYLLSQTKNNMNEIFKSYSISEYKLDDKGKDTISNIREKIGSLIDEIKNKNNEEYKEVENNFDKIKERLDKLYTECKKELCHVEYHLDHINIMSVSELADKSKSLPMIFLRFESQSKIIHHQVKGVIDFQYKEINKDEKLINSSHAEIKEGQMDRSNDNKTYDFSQLNKVTTNYYF